MDVLVYSTVQYSKICLGGKEESVCVCLCLGIRVVYWLDYYPAYYTNEIASRCNNIKWRLEKLIWFWRITFSSLSSLIPATQLSFSLHCEEMLEGSLFTCILPSSRMIVISRVHLCRLLRYTHWNWVSDFQMNEMSSAVPICCRW